MSGPLAITLRHLAARPAFTSLRSRPSRSASSRPRRCSARQRDVAAAPALPGARPDLRAQHPSGGRSLHYRHGPVAGVQIAEISESAPSVEHAVALIVSEGTVMPEDAPPRDILMVSRLYEVRAGDPIILTAAVLAVLAVTFVAFLVPALRATRITPAEALKMEQ